MDNLTPKYKTTAQDRTRRYEQKALNRDDLECRKAGAPIANGGHLGQSKRQQKEKSHFISQLSVEIAQGSTSNNGNKIQGKSESHISRDMATEMSEKCLRCRSESVMIVCCACGGDFCCTCVGMSVDTIAYYEEAPGGMKWFCNECLPSVNEAIKICMSGELTLKRHVPSDPDVKKLNEQMAEMQARMINVEMALIPNTNSIGPQNTNIQPRYRDALVARVSNTSIHPQQASTPTPRTTPAQAVQGSQTTHLPPQMPQLSTPHAATINAQPKTAPQTTQHNQAKPRERKSQLKLKSDSNEKERRKNNIIVHNLPESVQPKRADAERDDCNRVDEMIVEAMRIDDINTIKATRLGGKRRDGKPRLLLCKLNNHRDRVLRKARYVRMYEDWDNVFIDPDRTNLEQRQHELRRTEIRKQREAEESADSDSTFYSATDGDATIVISDHNLGNQGQPENPGQQVSDDISPEISPAENVDEPNKGGSESQSESEPSLDGSVPQTEAVPIMGGSDSQTEVVPSLGGSDSQTEVVPTPGGSDTQIEDQPPQESAPSTEEAATESSPRPDSASTEEAATESSPRPDSAATPQESSNSPDFNDN